MYNLREINLRFNSHMTKHGWLVINQGIKASSDHIQALNVLDCALDDDKAAGLLSDLHLKSLNNLNIGDNPLLTDLGWQMFNYSIKGSYSTLESINAWGCNLNDIKITILFDDMMFRGLKELNLSGNPCITKQGYTYLRKVIDYSQYSLKKLHLSGCDLDFDKITGLLGEIGSAEQTVGGEQ